MNISKQLAAIALGSLAIAAVAPALAADYDPPIFVEEAEEFQPVEVGNGWYLRGDLGYAVGGNMRDAVLRVYDPTTGDYVSGGMTSEDIDGDFGGGVGFGYRFTDFLRADVTADIFKASFDGSLQGDAPCDPVLFPGTTCRLDGSASGYRMSYMANGYVDLGTYSGLTPYLGGGIGVSRLKWDPAAIEFFCVPGAGPCPDDPVIASGSYGGTTSWRATYAAMAGLAYDVDTNLKLDFGYRFLYVDGGDMFNSGGATPTTINDEGHGIHELKVGLRYELW